MVSRIILSSAHPQACVTMIARRGGRWMRNPGGKGFFRVHPVSFRKGRRDRRAAEKPRLKPACSREEPPPWSPKESLSPPGPGSHIKLGVASNFEADDAASCQVALFVVFYEYESSKLSNHFLLTPGKRGSGEPSQPATAICGRFDSNPRGGSAAGFFPAAGKGLLGHVQGSLEDRANAL